MERYFFWCSTRIYTRLYIYTNGCLNNYVDDTTLYSIGENRNTNRNVLNKNVLSLQKWFYDNYMVLNPGKCCYMSFGSTPDKSDLILEESTKILSAEEYAILRVAIDNRLTFYNHLKNLCKKVANKLNAQTRIAPYLNPNQIRLIYNSFLRDSLAIALLFGHFVLGVQIILLTNFKNEH